ncbi:MAG: sigma-54 dependent transcriptional regulator [Bacteroidota bacterium]
MILIIDDDQAVLASLRLLFRQQGWETTAVKTPHTALAFLESERPDAVVLDMNFSLNTTGDEGLDLLQRILQVRPGLPVILLTGWATMELAIAGMKLGARDFLAKPWDNAQLVASLQAIIDLATPLTHTGNRKLLDQNYVLQNLIGEDPAFLEVLETVGRIAHTDASILILGESGTGKELIAEAIHQNSRRKEGTFVKVNLGGISANLFESELFGHVKGAFTDARSDRKGRFEIANGGTIFLDEIGELDLFSQVKLLRVLQDRTYEVLGSSQTRRVDVRVISATNRSLAEMVQEGNFREDLFYRINLITLKLPALRERASDIPILVQHFLQQFGQVYQRQGLQISAEALEWLQAYPFPGNVRQLRNLVERTVLMTSSHQLVVPDFQKQLGDPGQNPGSQQLPEVGSMSLEQMEKEMIVKALAHHSNHITRVAQALGITRSALYRRLEKYEIPHE